MFYNLLLCYYPKLQIPILLPVIDYGNVYLYINIFSKFIAKFPY